MRRAALVLSLLALAPPAGADETKPERKPNPELVAVLAFGARHPECEEWTDDCVVCVRGADAIHCSTPGIACQPGETVCKRAK
jgi:hypothetical protein